MRRNLFVFLFCAAAFDLFAQQGPPNIVFFLVDDMGWQDTEVPFWNQVTPFNQRYRTPNMRRLAESGLLFTNAYATPVCSPSRVSIMTGMNAARHRVTNWTLRKDISTDYPDTVLHAVDWNVNGMSPVSGIPRTVHATPLPKLLHEAGYYTIHCGKAHFGAMDTPGADPKNLGFDVNIAGHAAGGPGSYLGEKNYGNEKRKHTLPWGVPGLEQYHGSSTYLTEALTIEALKALEKPLEENKPFFLYLAHYAVHVPLEADPRFYQAYIEKGMDEQEAKYAALVEGMDKSLGDVMDYLEEKAIADNTIIIFFSDNGGFSQVPSRGGVQHTHNLPLRAGKGSVYEGGIRVPMLVRWPGVATPGSRSDQYCIAEDMFPSILEMAGIQKPALVQKPDGRSIVPFIKNSRLQDDKRVLLWHYPNKWIPQEGNGISWHSALRQGDWKLVYDQKSGQSELYNLQTDIQEQRNLSEEQPARAQRLKRLLWRYFERYSAQLPVRRAAPNSPGIGK